MRPHYLPPVVIVGLASVVGLQTARFFAGEGVRVIGLAGDRRHFAARTNACDQVIETDVHGPALVDALEELGPQLGCSAVLVPATDQAVLQISKHRERLQRWYRFPMPAHDVITALTDKAGFADCTSRLGLRTPATRVVTDVASAREAAEALAFPVVVKPALKSAAWRAVTSAKAHLLWQPGELSDLAGRALPAVSSLVVQEFVAGPDDELVTCNTYVGADGYPIMQFSTRKRRQWPPQLGIASYAEPCHAPDLEAAATELFTRTGFRGLGYLEAKRDHSTGELLLIEANVGRPTGRSAMAEACGVPLLKTMYADALGQELPSAVDRSQGDGGPRWVNLRRDAMASWYYWRRGELRPSQWFGELRRPTIHAVWSRDDPLPFVLEITQSISKLVTRNLRRIINRVRGGEGK